FQAEDGIRDGHVTGVQTCALPIFGNLIALPLQKRFRELGNSVFLDERFVPHSDQWKFLSLIRRIRRQEVEEIVHRADIKGQIIGVRLAPESEEDEDTPWKKPSRSRTKVSIIGPLPESLELKIG